MSFKDIIKKSVLNNFSNSAFTVKEIVYLLGMSVLIGIFIFMIYRLVCKQGFYSKAFNMSLVIMPIITATIIITIQTSIVVSLGMVGALSIVRFRTALKNPLDLMFMFWSISMGIVIGAALPIVACVMSLIVAIIMLAMNIIPMGSKGKLLNITTEGTVSEITEIVKKFDAGAKIKSQSYNGKFTNILYIVSSKCDTEAFDEMSKNEKIMTISIVEQEESQF